MNAFRTAFTTTFITRSHGSRRRPFAPPRRLGVLRISLEHVMQHLDPVANRDSMHRVPKGSERGSEHAVKGSGNAVKEAVKGQAVQNAVTGSGRSKKGSGILVCVIRSRGRVAGGHRRLDRPGGLGQHDRPPAADGRTRPTNQRTAGG